jgi:hypothetical protein
MAGVWYRFRADARVRWRAWVGLAVLIGLAGGVVLALAAGARRTDSAYGRFLDEQRSYDVALFLAPPAEQGLAQFDPDEVAALPQVEDLTTVDFFYADEYVAFADADGRFGTDINRFDFVDGRSADPSRPDEAVVGFELAREAELSVGDRITIIDPDEYAAADDPDPSDPIGSAYAALGRRMLDAVPDGAVTVVGIEASPGEFPPGVTTGLGQILHLTPAFARAVGGSPEVAPIQSSIMFIRLERGEADDAAFQRELARLGDGLPFQGLAQADNAANVQRSFHTQAVALQLLALLTALTALVIVSQFLARSAWLESADFPTLAAMGLTRGQRCALGTAKAVAVGAGAALLAGGLALAASPMFPTGLTRTAEIDPGFAVDGRVLAAGVAGVWLLVTAVGAAAAASAAWTGANLVGRGRSARPSLIGRALAGSRAPLSAVTGARMALEPGRGRTAVPVRSAIVCLALAFATVVASLSFGASLTHLLDTPRNYGVGWDLQFTIFFGEDGQSDPSEHIDEVAAAFAAADGVEAVSTGYIHIPFDLGGNGDGADAVVLDTLNGGDMVPVLEGRAPTAADEILLGSPTLEQLGLRIGDRVDAGSQGSPTRSMVIVGRGVIPPSADSSRVGEGSLLTIAGGRELIPGIDADFDAPSVFIRVEQSIADEALAERIADELGVDDYEVDTGRDTPSDIVSFGRVERLPYVLGAVIGVLAIAALAHVLTSAVRRRRRDLALLATLGFVPRQLRSAIAWQATALVLVSMAIGVPLGLALGRWIWTLFAEDLGVIVDPQVAGWALLGLVPAAVVIALVTAAAPGWLATRTPPAEALRNE